MIKYRVLRERFPTNDIYKEMNSLVIRLINMPFKRNFNIEAMEELV